MMCAALEGYKAERRTPWRAEKNRATLRGDAVERGHAESPGSDGASPYLSRSLCVALSETSASTNELFDEVRGGWYREAERRRS